MDKVLIIDDERQLRGLLARIIGLEGYEVIQAENCAAGLRQLERTRPEVVLCDVKLPDGNGVDLVGRIKAIAPDAEVILLTAYGNIPDGVQAIKNGAFDYITKGDDNPKIIPLLSRAMEKAKAQRKSAAGRQPETAPSFEAVIGSSKAMRDAVELARKVAATDTSVLLTGETGTGKEVFAQAIHREGGRSGKAFVAVNCSAFAKDLLESELFGHRAGAFTGAAKDKKGLFEEADGGTIFLDEVAELPHSTQARLLRVLQTGEFIRVGSSKVQKTNVRVVAATNVNLQEAIAKGRFREDLYYRLGTVPILVPSLRERPEDIPLLFRRFAADVAAQYRMPAVTLDDSAREMLMRYYWRGNIRQLKNVAEQISAIEQTRVISAEVLAKYLPPQGGGAPMAAGAPHPDDMTTERELLYKVLFDMRADINDLKRMMAELIQGAGRCPEPVRDIKALLPSTAQSSFIPAVPACPPQAPVYAESKVVTDEPPREMTKADMQREQIVRALRRNNGRRREAAAELFMSERTLYRKIKELGIEEI